MSLLSSHKRRADRTLQRRQQTHILMRRSCCDTAGNDEGEEPDNEKGPIMESDKKLEQRI